MRSQFSLLLLDCVDATSILNAFTWFLDIYYGIYATEYYYNAMIFNFVQSGLTVH
jgi:hypothetical protein